MLKPIKCIYCRNRTRIVNRRIRSKRNNAVIVINESPVYYCPHCNDVIIPLEVIAAFRYIKSQSLNEDSINVYDFKEVSTHAKINI